MTEESGSDSDSSSSLEFDNESGSELESSVGPDVLSESPPAELPSQVDLSVGKRFQVNREQRFSLEPGTNLPLKGDQNISETASNDSTKKKNNYQKRKP